MSAGGKPAMDKYPIQGEVEYSSLVNSCYSKQDKLWADRPLWWNADLTFYPPYLTTKKFLFHSTDLAARDMGYESSMVVLTTN